MSWSLQAPLPLSRCDALKYWLKWFPEFVYCLLSKYRSRSLSADPHHHPLEPILYTLPIACQSGDLEPGHIWQKPKLWAALRQGYSLWIISGLHALSGYGKTRTRTLPCHHHVRVSNFTCLPAQGVFMASREGPSYAK